MKRLLLILPLIASAGATPQSDPVLSAGTGNTCNLDWTGVDDRTYFVQYSEDLVTWFYFDIIEPGVTDFAHGYGFSCTSDDSYYRLRWSDIVTADPDNADFDNDGLSNIDELTSHETDPLDEDTDGDTINDGLELTLGGSPLSTDTDEDGAGDGTEVAAGTLIQQKDNPLLSLGVVVTAN